MKKILSITLAILMVLSLVACASNSKKDNTNVPTDKITENDATSSNTATDSSSTNKPNNNTSDNNTSNNDTSNNNSSNNNSSNNNTSNNNNSENQNPVQILKKEDREKIKALLLELLNDYDVNPVELIPETMLRTNASKVTTKDAIPSDYSEKVNVSDIPNVAMGEQWDMVLDNLSQTNIFFNVLNTADSAILSSTSYITAFFEKEDVTSPRYTFTVNSYSITVDYDGTNVYYVMNLGSVQISMIMNASTKIKTVRIQATDNNALSYTINGKSYTFAISYLGVRQAYIQIKQGANNTVEGSIYEYAALAHQFANFYIDDTYVSVIGDALDDNLVSDDYVIELYDVKTRKLLAFETQETTGAIIKKKVSTVWLNLCDVNGINSVLYDKLGEDDDKGFYLNGSSTQWVAGEEKNNRPIFDIEFVKQYFVYMDGEDFEIKNEDVPMLRVQEASLEDITELVKKANPSYNISITLSASHINRLKSDYAKYVNEDSIEKNNVSAEEIISLIGNKTVFN